MTHHEFKAIRLALGLSQKALGEVIDMSGRNVRRIESGLSEFGIRKSLADKMRELEKEA